MIEQAKFTFKKKINTFENKGKKWIKAIEEHGKQLAESNTLNKKCDYHTEKNSPAISKKNNRKTQWNIKTKQQHQLW